jgi:hypothetical protein
MRKAEYIRSIRYSLTLFYVEAFEAGEGKWQTLVRV